MTDINIYSKRCWYNNALVPATIEIRNGVITDILSHKTADAYDAGNCIVMPGVVDAHVHVNEPGRTEWEGFETATYAAAKGGITTIVDMPLNADPVTTTLRAFTEKINSAENKLHVNSGFYGGLVPSNSNQLPSLIQGGVLGIKCFLTHSGIDEFPNVTEEDLNLAMPLIAKHGSKLLVHCELLEKNDAIKWEDAGSYMSYMKSRPDECETRAVKLMIDLCRKHGCPVHIVHVSSSQSLLYIEQAKAEGLPVTAETCAHYIYFNAEQIPDNKPVYKCAPPIRTKENNDKLRAALGSGVLDFLTSDHSPAPPQIKEIQSGNIFKAWGGIAGLQFLLSAGWTACRGSMSIETFIPLFTSKPASFLGLEKRKGKIQIGFDADIIIWNPEESFTVMIDDIEHKHKISPYIGEELYGVVERTIVNGQLAFNRATQMTYSYAGKLIFNADSQTK